MADSASVVLRDAVINTSITSVGDATIILEGESTVQGTGAGIQAGPSGKSLTIKGNGKLTVQGAANCAAIGTGNGGTCGQIVITKNVVSVFASKGGYTMHSIGKGTDDSTIGSMLIGGTSGAISASQYVYPETYFGIWNFIDVKTFNLASGKETKGSVGGCTLSSKGGTVVEGHMSGKFNFVAPYNRQFTKITIKGTCYSVSGEGWTTTETGVEWSGTPAQYVHIECNIADVRQITFIYQ